MPVSGRSTMHPDHVVQNPEQPGTHQSTSSSVRVKSSSLPPRKGMSGPHGMSTRLSAPAARGTQCVFPESPAVGNFHGDGWERLGCFCLAKDGVFHVFLPDSSILACGSPAGIFGNEANPHHVPRYVSRFHWACLEMRYPLNL